MTDSVPKQLPPYGLRIPPEMKERLQKSAKNNNRSMQAEIIARLESSFEAGPDDIKALKELVEALTADMRLINKAIEKGMFEKGKVKP